MNCSLSCLSVFTVFFISLVLILHCNSCLVCLINIDMPIEITILNHLLQVVCKVNHFILHLKLMEIFDWQRNLHNAPVA